MNRRNLFKGLAGVAAGMILPPTLEENAEAGRRIWALGGIPTDAPAYPMPAYRPPGLAVIDYDEVIHNARLLEEQFYPLRPPTRLMPRAVEGATLLNAGSPVYLLGAK